MFLYLIGGFDHGDKQHKMPVKKAIYLRRGSGFVSLEHFSHYLGASAVLRSENACYLTRKLHL